MFEINFTINSPADFPNLSQLILYGPDLLFQSSILI
jgi:hypothetical protein